MSSQSTLTILPSLGEYFRDPVSQALRGQEVSASAATESYIVELLAHFANPCEDARSTLREPLTFLLRDALAQTGAERFRRLQMLGDGVLYGVGFFGEGIDDADRRYFIHVGQSAYGHAATMLSMSAANDTDNVLGELARRFDRYVAVLRDVSDFLMAMAARGQADVVRIYERWQRTGSRVLADALGQRGLVPMRAVAGQG